MTASGTWKNSAPSSCAARRSRHRRGPAWTRRSRRPLVNPPVHAEAAGAGEVQVGGNQSFDGRRARTSRTQGSFSFAASARSRPARGRGARRPSRRPSPGPPRRRRRRSNRLGLRLPHTDVQGVSLAPLLRRVDDTQPRALVLLNDSTTATEPSSSRCRPRSPPTVAPTPGLQRAQLALDRPFLVQARNDDGEARQGLGHAHRRQC